MSLIAINVLLDPDAETVKRARAVNARLLESYPAGFAFDDNHAPHVTVVQCYVPTRDLEAVASAVSLALKTEQAANWCSSASGYYDVPQDDIGLVGIVIEPTEKLRLLQQKVMSAIAPYVKMDGTGEAFAPRLDGADISRASIDYVCSFVGERTGMNYHPHLTVGIGTRQFIDTLEAEAFLPFAVRPVGVSLYQLGEYGVAQRKLLQLHAG